MLKFQNLLTTNSKLLNIKQNYSFLIKPVELAYDYYDSNGTKPPLLILHSLCGTKECWRNVCETMQKNSKSNRKIYAFDARNHGSSERSVEHSYAHMSEDIANFITKKKIDKVAVMGHSMGGRALMHFTLKHPTLVDKAVFLDVSPLDKPPPAEIIFSKILLSIMKNTIIPSSMNIGECRAFAGEIMRQFITKEFEINYLLQNLTINKNKKHTWTLNIDALQNYVDTVDIFPNSLCRHTFRNPVLFIAGVDSHYMNQNNWPAIQEIFPNSKLSWIKAGHLLHIESPKDIVELVSNFLNT